MKTTDLILYSCLLALSAGSVFADDDGKTFGDGTLPSLLAIYDLDNSGDLSNEEAKAMQDARKDARETGRADILAEFDLDGDGNLNKDERKTAQDALAARIIATRAEYFLNADPDESGTLSLEEFQAIPSIANLAKRRPNIVDPIFRKLDKNKNNLIELSEFLSRLTPPQNPN